MSISKKIKTLCFQLKTSMSVNAAFLRNACVIEDEFKLCESSSNEIDDSQRAQLNRVLHSTRAFDSGLRLFLEKHGCLNNNPHSIGDYIKELQRVRNGHPFRQLSGMDATNINTLITNERNKYMHAAGQFPTKAEADVIVGNILIYFQRILGLE